jgi:hypothetical protein
MFTNFCLTQSRRIYVQMCKLWPKPLREIDSCFLVGADSATREIRLGHPFAEKEGRKN